MSLLTSKYCSRCKRDTWHARLLSGVEWFVCMLCGCRRQG